MKIHAIGLFLVAAALRHPVEGLTDPQSQVRRLAAPKDNGKTTGKTTTNKGFEIGAVFQLTCHDKSSSRCEKWWEDAVSYTYADTVASSSGSASAEAWAWASASASANIFCRLAERTSAKAIAAVYAKGDITVTQAGNAGAVKHIEADTTFAQATLAVAFAESEAKVEAKVGAAAGTSGTAVADVDELCETIYKYYIGGYHPWYWWWDLYAQDLCADAGAIATADANANFLTKAKAEASSFSTAGSGGIYISKVEVDGANIQAFTANTGAAAGSFAFADTGSEALASAYAHAFSKVYSNAFAEVCKEVYTQYCTSYPWPWCTSYSWEEWCNAAKSTASASASAYAKAYGKAEAEALAAAGVGVVLTSKMMFERDPGNPQNNNNKISIGLDGTAALLPVCYA